MSRKRTSKNKNSGSGWAVLLCLVFVWLAIRAIRFVNSNISSVIAGIMLLAVFAGVVSTVVALVRFIKKKKVRRNECISIINMQEESPEGIKIPSSMAFANSEEKEVNLSFRNYLRHHNEVLLSEAHLGYLSRKVSALRELHREDEAANVQKELDAATAESSGLREKNIGTFSSRYLNTFTRSTEIQNAYLLLASKLQDARLPLIGDFFQDPMIKAVPQGANTVLLFTPCYVMAYDRTSQMISLIEYSSVYVFKRIQSEMIKGNVRPGDEVEHVGYLYETKSGQRNMRYSIENNPSRIYVYRGAAEISCGKYSFELKFPNKSLTELFVENFKGYMATLQNRYSVPLGMVLRHDESLLEYHTVDDFLKEKAVYDEKIRKRKEEVEKNHRLEVERQREIERRKAEEAKRVQQEHARREREAKEYEERARKIQEEAQIQAAKQEQERQAQIQRDLVAQQSKKEVQRAKELAEQEAKKREATERELRRARDSAAREALKREEIEKELRRVRDQAAKEKKDREEAEARLTRIHEDKSKMVSEETQLSGLSEEERRVILEMRQKRRQGQVKKAPLVSEDPGKPNIVDTKIEYVMQGFDDNKVKLSLQDDKYKITNNIFSLIFVQDSVAGSDRLPAEYETFVSDSKGRIISNIKTIVADKTGVDLTHKVSFSLSAQEKFDKQADYFVMLRYKGETTRIINKTKYQINIDFASDFDDF